MARSMLCGLLLLGLSQLAFGLFGSDAFLNHDISELQVMFTNHHSSMQSVQPRVLQTHF
jgi:hypothetical protein